MNWFLRVNKATVLGLMTFLLGGCGSFVAYYDVNGTQDTLCVIQGTSTICEDGRSAFTMTLGVEESDGKVILYWDNASWEATSEDDGSFRAVRYHEIQDTTEACHTIQSEILRVALTEDTVEGTWVRESQTDGPATCGEMPAGQKDSISLEGVRAESL
tara:strand:+ start:4333 stop:4806 length:474 start_codon:yes stop_codon:yes gene_type:complete